MSTATDNVTISSVIAAAAGQRTHGPFRAVMMRHGPAGPELVWKAIDDGTGCDFKGFVERVLPSAVSASSNGSAPAGVLGLDCADVAFYRVEVPPVSDHQLGPIVRMQAESILPLPADRMQMAWRAEAARDGKRRCSIAAARSDQLGTLARDMRSRTSRIIINAEGVVKAWAELFEGAGGRAVLIHMRRHDTQILLADRGVLRHAVTADVGIEDLDAAAEAELFVHDVRGALESLGDGETPVYVIGADAERYEPAIAALKRAGIQARLSRPANNRLRYAEAAPGDAHAGSGVQAGLPVDAEDICEYLECIGLGLIVLEGEVQTLNLFDGLLTSSGSKAKRTAPALILALLVAVVIAIASAAAWKAMDTAALARLNDPELNRLIERQKTRQLIAMQRPDVLEIIAIITEHAPPGMLVDNFEFKKGSPVVISTFAKTREELYAFEKKMDSHKDISQVRVVNPIFDEKQNRINFKMEFNYKRFSEKK